LIVQVYRAAQRSNLSYYQFKDYHYQRSG